jgi:SAM-dependent methyltransferase
MKLDHHRRTDCRLCNGDNLVSVLKLESTPPANAFVTEEQKNKKQICFPLELFFCRNCYHVQLLDVISPKLLFENYIYVSGTSKVFVKHFEEYAKEILKKYPLSKNSRVLDIGSNDGTLLQFFKDQNYSVLGVDPAKKISETSSKNGIETLTDFFNFELSMKIRQKYGSISLITANNVFAHIDDLNEFVKGIHHLLSKDGIFVFEVSYLADVIKNTLFDMTYHEHLSYHSIIPLISFFQKNNLELIDVIKTDVHGGSIRCIVQLQGGVHIKKDSVNKIIGEELKMKINYEKTYKEFGDKINKQKIELANLLKKIKNENKTIMGFGAPAKSTTLLYHFNINSNTVECIVDDNKLKQNLFSPGKHIPIVTSETIYDKKPDYLLILAWNFAESIMKNHQKFKKQGGKFIIPLPRLIVI